MSLAETCVWTLVRTLALCLLAWPVCHAIERLLRSLSDVLRPWVLAGMLAPFCFPELLVGYAFRDFALAQPRWAESLCSALLFLRIVPVGASTLLAAPNGDRDSEAIHCRWMLVRSRHPSRRDWFELARCYWHGPITRAIPALALMSIVAFQEFETAALLQTMSWTDWFVAAQRLGLNQTEMLAKSLWPMLIQLPLLLGVMYWLGQTSNLRGEGDSLECTDGSPHAHRWTTRLATMYLFGAFVAGCVVPLGLIGWRTVEGLGSLLRQPVQQWGLAREIVTTMSVAACAGIAAWTVTRRTSNGAQRGLLLPGLFGSLLLALCVVAVFQQSWLRPLYDTPIPWVLALTLWLLPRAAVLRLWLQATQQSESVYLAEMLERTRNGGPGASEKNVPSRKFRFWPDGRSRSALLWRLRDQPRFLAASLLCYWAYCDLPTAYLLAPTGMASGLVRLYNFMHFGRSAALSAEAILFFGTPILVVVIALATIRYWRD